MENFFFIYIYSYSLILYLLGTIFKCLNIFTKVNIFCLRHDGQLDVAAVIRRQYEAFDILLLNYDDIWSGWLRI